MSDATARSTASERSHADVCVPLPRRYVEPKPRADGFFVAGIRGMHVRGNIWRVMGNTGEVRGAVGMKNATFKKPIGEHVKNILRGRARWGCTHQLSRVWAQLPAGQMELTKEQAYPAPSAKRKRAPAADGPSQMANLDEVVCD